MGNSPSTFKPPFHTSALLRNGVTLIELVMITVILGIIAVVALPRFEIYYEIKLQSAGKKLVSDIRFAQNKAMTRHADTRIYFDNTTDVYQAEYCDSSCGTSGNWHPLRDPSSGADLRVDYTNDPQFSGVDIADADFGGTDTLRFNWDGIPQSSTGASLTALGTIVMTLKGRSLTVTVQPQTGKLTVQ